MIYFDKGMQKILSRFSLAKFFLWILFGYSIVLTSCDKSSEVGLGVQPANDFINVGILDTLTLITKTETMESLRTDETFIQGYTTDPLSRSYMLGTYIDPTFGKTSSSIYMQLRLNVANPDFGTNPIIDSAILSLVYDPVYYGDNSFVKQNVNVYEVVEKMNISDSYYSNTVFNTSTTDIANKFGFVPSPNKSVSVPGDPISIPQLRVKLDNAYGQSILNEQNTINLSTNEIFQDNWKGLYITTANTANLTKGQGNILRFNLEDTQSGLTIYCHYYQNDTLKYSQYMFGSVGTAHVSSFNHDYSVGVDASLGSQLSSNITIQNENVFIQSMAGLKVKIEMPYIMNLNNPEVFVVNKAELVVKVNISDVYQQSTFTEPPKLVLYGINDDGSSYFLPDFAGPFKFGGDYNSSTNQYRINISSYIQQILIGKRKNNGLYLQALSGAISPYRAVIGGGASSSPFQMKLEITKTKLP
jgi:hypothetical protein